MLLQLHVTLYSRWQATICRRGAQQTCRRTADVPRQTEKGEISARQMRRQMRVSATGGRPAKIEISAMDVLRCVDRQARLGHEDALNAGMIRVLFSKDETVTDGVRVKT